MPTRYRYLLPLRASLLLVAAIISALVPGFDTRAVAQAQVAAGGAADFPPELVDWARGPVNPVFTPGGAGCWDLRIRERGWILREDDAYHLWYTGYDGTRQGTKRLGYAVSEDGMRWKPSAKNPLCPNHWIEDVMVVKHGDSYYMFAEGAANGHAELLTSKNRVDWNWEGPLDIRLADGTRQAKPPCGTPTVWVENGVWYLFYEHHDLGIWLATSIDPRSRVWTNVQDDPVMVPGPADYDKQLIALDQIIKHDGEYFALYHASRDSDPRTWNTNVARSTDLVNWRKFSGNPIVEDNKSSGILVADGPGFRLYTMHEQIEVFFPRTSKLSILTARRVSRIAPAADGQ
jgi:beta-1,2-mannobiose phosphorylase / 1,2-beta-oligomannan phosphorylase